MFTRLWHQCCQDSEESYPFLHVTVRKQKNDISPQTKQNNLDWPTWAQAEGNLLVELGEQFCITQATDECDLILLEKRYYHGYLNLVVKGNKALQCFNWLQPYIIKEREGDEVKSMVARRGTWIRTGPANERTFIMLKAVMDAGTTVPPRGGKTPVQAFFMKTGKEKKGGSKGEGNCASRPSSQQ